MTSNKAQEVQKSRRKKGKKSNDDDDEFWNIENVEYEDNSKKWNELDTTGKLLRVVFSWFFKPVILLACVYFFICAIHTLGNAFQLLGGKEAGEVMSNSELLSNPIAGVTIGILATALLQSSSMVTAILISMASSEVITVKLAIPMVMGANIGTSVTNTAVSLGHMKNNDEFRRAFAGATIHDMFNFLSTFILLPLEAASGYLYHLTKAIVDSLDIKGRKMTQLLHAITWPFNHVIVLLDTKVIADIAKGKDTTGRRLLKQQCGTGKYERYFQAANVTRYGNETLRTLTVLSRASVGNVTRYDAYNELATYPTINETTASAGSMIDRSWLVLTETELTEKCHHMFDSTTMSDAAVGVIVLFIALFIIFTCLYGIVKVLHSVLRGQMAKAIRKAINADFPDPFGFLTGYVAILFGTGVTMVIQSSSVFTSALTPLVGVGALSLERMLPLTIGANLGTTLTGLLAALATTGDFSKALQLAMCHLFFNISGFLLWYPIPYCRRLPVYLARQLGNTTAKYRWFSIVYIVITFFLLPVALFGLSIPGWYVLLAVAGPIFILVVAVVIINTLQRKRPEWIHPEKLRDWDWLPLCMHSLRPIDRLCTMCLPQRWRRRDDIEPDDEEDDDDDDVVEDVEMAMVKELPAESSGNAEKPEKDAEQIM